MDRIAALLKPRQPAATCPSETTAAIARLLGAAADELKSVQDDIALVLRRETPARRGGQVPGEPILKPVESAGSPLALGGGRIVRLG